MTQSIRAVIYGLTAPPDTVAKTPNSRHFGQQLLVIIAGWRLRHIHHFLGPHDSVNALDFLAVRQYVKQMLSFSENKEPDDVRVANVYGG